jgi:septal ring factor EnvC (AmiA/AmiB activator)
LALANSARFSLLATTVWILAASCSGHALAQPTDDIDTTEVEIDALRADIRAIQARLTAQEEQRDTLHDELRESEQLISRVDQDLDMLVSQQRALEEDWARLTAETDRLRDNQNALSAGIEASIQQLWVLQQGGGLRIWLGGQSPHQAARHLAYYQLIVEEQRTQLLAYQAGLSELEAHTRMVEDAEQKLATQAEAIAARRMQLTAQQESKQQTLADITNALREDEQALQVLLQNQERLNSLLSELKALAITPALQPEPERGYCPCPLAVSRLIASAQCATPIFVGGDG